MQIVIIRPVLVYGPGVRGNFAAMMRWLARGVPLPFGAVDNKRSLVALDNLVSLIVTCAFHPTAANQTFLVSDGEDLSTTELLRRTAHALNRTIRLVPIPTAALLTMAIALGKRRQAQRLLGSLQVDARKAGHLLGWKPVATVDEGLRAAAESFLGAQGLQ